MGEFVTVRVTTEIPVVLGQQINILCRQMVRTSEQEQLWLLARPGAPCQGYLSSWEARTVSDMQGRCKGAFNSKQGVLHHLRLLLRTQREQGIQIIWGISACC